MALTLRSLLDLDAVSLGRPEVVAAASSLDRIVRWVHVTEIEHVTDVLRGHEVVLTTGLPLTGSLPRSLRFVEQLAAADACGLVVELGDDLPELHPDVVATAERLDLPLIVLRSSVQFVSITEAVHRLIIGEHYAGLEFAQRTHEVFTDLSLDSADAPRILAEAAELIDGPVVLEDSGHRVIALAAHGSTSRRLLGSWDTRSRMAPSLAEPGTTGPESWLTCPVGLRGAVWGRLIAPDSDDSTSQTAMVMQRAAQALQLSRLVERDANRLQFQARESLLQQLADGQIREEADALARARALGLPASVAAYVPVVVAFESSPLPDQIARQRRSRSRLETVTAALRVARVDAIAGGLASGHVGIIVAMAAASDEGRTLTAVAAAISERSSHHDVPGSAPVIGAGQQTPSLVAAASRMAATTYIAEAARALGTSPLTYFRSTDVRVRGLVAQLQHDERLIGFAESELGPLLAHEAQTASGLVDLLRHYVRLNGNKAAVAKAVHVSRQTLYGRLRRIEAILLVDLDEPDSLLSLGLAILTHDTRLAPDSRPGER